MANTNIPDESDIDLLLRRAMELVAHSPRVRRTDGISWLQRKLKIGHQQAIRVMEGLVASGELIRVPEAAGYSYLKAGDGEVHRVCKVMVLSALAMTKYAALTKWHPFLSGLGEVELEVEVTHLPSRSAPALSVALCGEEWDYFVVDGTSPEFAPS